MNVDDLTPLQAYYLQLNDVALALGGTVGCLLALVLGMAFVRNVR